MEHHEHFLEQHDPERKDFQIDRIILFSDAVFAIAITLLVIEIKVPDFKEHSTTDGALLHYLYTQLPKFIGFIISFGVIAIYWRSHHRIFGFVSAYSDKLIWLNVLFLFTIVLMPFSSAFYSEYTLFDVPYYFYNINIILTGIVNYRMIQMVFNPKNHLVTHQPGVRYLSIFKARSFITPTIFLAGIISCPFFPVASRFCFMLTWPTFWVLRWYFKRKYKDDAPIKVHPVKHKKAHSI